MTDEQIIKTLVLCYGRACDKCPRRDNEIPYEDTCRMELIRIAGDIIERQKAEIENYSVVKRNDGGKHKQWK